LVRVAKTAESRAKALPLVPEAAEGQPLSRNVLALQFVLMTSVPILPSHLARDRHDLDARTLLAGIGT
jgi:hypothetical protein